MRQTHVHGLVDGSVNGLYGDTGKKWPTTAVDGTGRAPWETGQNNVHVTNAYTDP